MSTHDVFISWGAPDRDTVLPLARRLRQLGLAVFEYSHDMAFGDAIAARVQDAIAASTMAIVCLSRDSWDREWITTEVAWLETAMRARSMRAVIPIQAGPMGDRNQLPSLLRNRGLFVGDFSDRTRSEEILETLVDKVFEVLGGSKPLWLPTAIFAMTQAQFDALVLPRPQFLQLCTYVGMDGDFPTLRGRYGTSAEAFAPFAGGPLVKDTVGSAVARLNLARKLRRLPPIHLRWANDELVDTNDERRRRARDRWGQRHSLMLIDSLSVFHDATRTLVTSLAAQRDRTIVVWIPPYTTRTGELERLIDAATSDFDQLNDCVRHWYQPANEQSPDVRKRVFDVGTHAGLWHWLFLMLADLDDRGPDTARLGEMQSAMPGPTVSPGKWIA